jgi:hypothetical protein
MAAYLKNLVLGLVIMAVFSSEALDRRLSDDDAECTANNEYFV